MTPGQVKHLFGLKLVQMPDDTCKLIGIVVSSPKLKGPNAEPAAAVQTTMSLRGGQRQTGRRRDQLEEVYPDEAPDEAPDGRTDRRAHRRLRR